MHRPVGPLPCAPRRRAGATREARTRSSSSRRASSRGMSEPGDSTLSTAWAVTSSVCRRPSGPSTIRALTVVRRSSFSGSAAMLLPSLLESVGLGDVREGEARLRLASSSRPGSASAARRNAGQAALEVARPAPRPAWSGPRPWRSQACPSPAAAPRRPTDRSTPASTSSRGSGRAGPRRSSAGPRGCGGR